MTQALSVVTDNPAPTVVGPRPIGRPTTYRKEYCARVIALGYQGECSLASIGAMFGTSKSTVLQWRDKNREFANAIKMAHATAEQYWASKYAIASLENGRNMAQGYACFHMKNQFGWTDSKELHHSGEVVHKHSAANKAFASHIKGLASPGKDDAIDAEYTVIE